MPRAALERYVAPATGKVDVVFSMGRSGSHTLRDAVREAGFGWPPVLHAAYRSDGYMAPRGVDEGDEGPEGVGEHRAELARRLRDDKGVVAIVPVRNPVDRAVSAWRYFHGSKAEVGEWGHSHADRWWERQLDRCMMACMPVFPREQGWMIWEGRHRVVLVRIEDAERVIEDAVTALTGRRERLLLGRKVESEKPREPVFSDAFVRWVRGSDTARRFYSKEEIEEALCRVRT